MTRSAPLPPSARETIARLSSVREDLASLQAEASALRAHLLTFADEPPTLSREVVAMPAASSPASLAQQTPL